MDMNVQLCGTLGAMLTNSQCRSISLAMAWQARMWL